MFAFSLNVASWITFLKISILLLAFFLGFKYSPYLIQCWILTHFSGRNFYGCGRGARYRVLEGRAPGSLIRPKVEGTLLEGGGEENCTFWLVKTQNLKYSKKRVILFLSYLGGYSFESHFEFNTDLMHH